MSKPICHSELQPILARYHRFCIGEDAATKPETYIGETEHFKERVKDHDNKKSFWQKALVFVSKDADMTNADVQYLEYKAIAVANESNTFILSDNKQTPKAINLP